MPCLVLTGHPCAGKTTLAHVIADRAKSHFGITKVEIISEGTACPNQSRQDCYSTSQAEKVTRGALKASLDRALLDTGSSSSSSNQAKQQQQHLDQNKDGGHDTTTNTASSTLVILDSLNYIKGFRYELYCLSKAAQQQHGVVWVLNSLDVAKEWNRQRLEAETDSSYSMELLDELVLRFEPPDERNRWDRPLFCIDVQPENTQSSTGNTTTTTTSTVSSQQALEKSVYNMHELSSVLNTNETNTQTPPTNTENVGPSSSVKKVPKARFKRAKKKTEAAATNSTKAPGLGNDTPSAVSGDSPAPNAQTQDPVTNDKIGETSQPPSTTMRRKTVQEQVDAMLQQFLQSTQPLQQGMSTQQHLAHSNANLMHLLDHVTQQVCRAIVARRSTPDSSTEPSTGTACDMTTLSVRLPAASSSSHENVVNVQLDRRLLSHTEQLQPWRRQYLKWCTNHPPPSGNSQLAQEFCNYLQVQVASSDDHSGNIRNSVTLT